MNCSECRYFKYETHPEMDFYDRVTYIKEKFPEMNKDMVRVLAMSPELHKQKNSTFGKCNNRKLPMLRDVQLPEDFGCTRFKK